MVIPGTRLRVSSWCGQNHAHTEVYTGAAVHNKLVLYHEYTYL